MGNGSGGLPRAHGQKYDLSKSCNINILSHEIAYGEGN